VGGRPLPDGVLAVSEVDELVARALALDDDNEQEDEEYWQIVLELQQRGDRETFEAARALCLAEPDDARCLGAAVLAQLGARDGRPFLEESLPLVIGLCREGASDDVLAASLHALGHLQDARAVPSVLAQRRHPDPTVRLAVAQSAEGVAGEPPDPEVVAAVVELSRDEDDDVRNWATFSLALLFEIDTPGVREALHARLDDPDEVTSAEALAGLAARGDPRAPDAVGTRLLAATEGGFSDHAVAELIVDAAELLGDPRFIAALATLREQEDDPDWCERLTEAITSCASPA
jgi:HEAT repeat protein